MNDLFRFLVLRPAQSVAPDRVDVVRPSIPIDDPESALAQLRLSDRLAFGAHGLTYGPSLAPLADEVANGKVRAGELAARVHDTTGMKLAALVDDDRFQSDEARVADTLVAVKLASGAPDVDAVGLARLRQLFDAMHRVLDGEVPDGPVPLRTLALPTDLQRPQPPAAPDAGAAPDEPGADNRVAELGTQIAAIDSALATLKRVDVRSFAAVPIERPAPPVPTPADPGLPPAPAGTAPDPAGGYVHALAVPPAARVSPVESGTTSAWALSAEAAGAMPAAVHDVVASVGLDLAQHPLPALAEALVQQRATLSAERVALTTPMEQQVSVVGSSVFGPLNWPYFVPDVPTTHGNLKPIGIGDLLLVRQHVTAYEGGDVAHIENVLRTEKLKRETRRLDKTVTTDTTETETDTEQERDSQSTERFSLNREVSDTIKTDASLKAGLSVDAKYGPFVEVKATADLSTSTAVERSTKTATQYSKEVVSRSVDKLTQKIKLTRSVTTTTEYEEWYRHGFDNTDGAGNVSGVYQWVNKLSQAQILNYGKRLLFDAVVPEPAAFYLWAAQNQVSQGQTLTKPTPFTATPEDFDEGTAQFWAAKYEATDLQPAPPMFKTFSKAWDGTNDQDPRLTSKSDTIAVDDGYQVTTARTASQAIGTGDDYVWRLLVGSNIVDAWSNVSTYLAMNNETGTVPVSMFAQQVRSFSVTIEALGQRSDSAYAGWQYRTHASITQAYQVKLRAYEDAVANARAQAASAVTGRNPLANAAVIRSELRKSCIAELTAQQFHVFGAVKIGPGGYPELDLGKTEHQGEYIRFFEQAFEWEHLTYFCYPYFWAGTATWRDRSMFDDVDPDFADFLRAGAARVVFPVRPGFEAAVVHYLETGEIWNGGDARTSAAACTSPSSRRSRRRWARPGPRYRSATRGRSRYRPRWCACVTTTASRPGSSRVRPGWSRAAERCAPRSGPSGRPLRCAPAAQLRRNRRGRRRRTRCV